MTLPDNDLIQKIQKMLALAEGATNPNEAAAAAAKATELLQRHNLDMAAVRAATHQQAAIGEVEFDLDGDEGRKLWLTLLADAVAKANYCYPLYTRRIVIFIGAQDQLAAVCFIFSNLYHRLKEMAEAEGRNYDALFKKANGFSAARAQGNFNLRFFKRKFLEGAAIAIELRLRTQRQTFEAQDARALVLVRDADVQTYLAREYPDVPVRKNAGVGDMSNELVLYALRAGYQAGKNIEFQQGLAGETAVAALPAPVQ